MNGNVRITNTMVKECKPKREHEPIVHGSHEQVDVEEYIEAMVRSEKLAAEKLQWSEAEWAGHCMTHDAYRRKRKRGT